MLSLKDREPKRIQFNCPSCSNDFVGAVDVTVYRNMCFHFPDTFGAHKLVCNDCLPFYKAILKVSYK